MLLDVSRTFCFPGITSDTISPGPIPKDPRRPQRRISCGITPAARVGLCGAGLSMFWVHSQRETWARVPHPTVSLTAKVLGNSGSAPPQVSIWGVVSLHSSSSVVPWDCASSFAPARLSRGPRSGCDSPPWPLPGVSPCQTQGVSILLTRLLLLDYNLTLTRNHSSLTSSGHTFSG